MTQSLVPTKLDAPPTAGKHSFVSLRTKFVIYFSLILIVTS